MATNPYAVSRITTDRTPGEAPGPLTSLWGGVGRYSVPDVPETTDPEYTTGFSPTLRSGGSPDGSQLPDDIRMGFREPPVTNYNDPQWERHRDSEFLQRHSVEKTHTQWKIRQEKTPPGQNPLWGQERNPVRPTATDSPTGYAFQRPWHIPRNAREALGDGATLHFSLADHRRVYAIQTMAPRGRMGVNTYRASPRPWDEALYVPPPAGSNQGALAGNRNYRLV